MLANISKKSMLKVLAAGSCGAIFSLAALTADVSAESVNIIIKEDSTTTATTPPTTTTALTPGNCLYSLQLASDPALRAAFTVQITSLTNGNETLEADNTDLYHTNIAVNTPLNRSSSGLDKLSNDCLSCHDGVMAPSFNVRIKNNPAGRVMSLEDIIGGHPVGMEYEKYASVNSREYRREVSFSREMVFAAGKVGCLTCHNPLNTAKGHLVMNNDRSELCFACHNK
jgi:predicted CXXCH cytochrome family protein